MSIQVKNLARNKDISIRTDVLYKAILRMIKRYLTLSLHKLRSSKIGMLSNIQKIFCENSELPDSKMSLDLIFMIGAFINLKQMKTDVESVQLSSEQL